MKIGVKKWALMGLLSMCIGFGYAQTPQHGDVANKGDWYLNVGVGIPYLTFMGNTPQTFSFPYSLGVELGITPWLGLGPQVGFVNFPASGAQYWELRMRGAVRIGVLLDEQLDLGFSKAGVDVYLAINPGVRLEYANVVNGVNAVRVSTGVQLGCRYHLTETFGVFAEGGVGFQNFGRAGLSVRLVEGKAN